MNNMHQEHPPLYFASLADLLQSVHRELEKAEQQTTGERLQTLHLAEARLKLIAALSVIDRVLS